MAATGSVGVRGLAEEPAGDRIGPASTRRSHEEPDQAFEAKGPFAGQEALVRLGDATEQRPGPGRAGSGPER